MFRKSLEEVLRDRSDKLIIDLRKREEYEKETVPGAIHIYHEDFTGYISRLPKNKRIYLFCYTGDTSDGFAEDLSRAGYDIYSIEGGYHAYLRYKLKGMKR